MVTILAISVVFFILNTAYILLKAPYYSYPITALFFFIIFAYRFIISLQKEEERLTDEINYNFVQNLPRERLLKELKMAKHVQQALLLVESPNIQGINIAKKCIPADNIGGDFYSFISKDFDEMAALQRSPGIVKYVQNENQYLGIVIGDVAGHGVSSALIMALSSGLFSEIGKRFPSPKRVLEAANKDLMRYIENSQVTHVTAFYGVLNVNTYEFSYCRAGHPGIILQNQNNDISELNAEGSFLGMFDNIEFEENKVQLSKGDRLFFYTDGITEAKGPDGDLFGNERLVSQIQRLQQEPIGTVLHQIFDDVDLYTQYQKATDDRSLVILELN
ncbi:MAG: PP2C family protein-serine/threonine phosphatase [Candidatus Margulisiibacteriota bacterium]|nr:PP2C family protein-serine/threonine phosphatase [Candidatus Margulisiibacteriota bacterium]